MVSHIENWCPKPSTILHSMPTIELSYRINQPGFERGFKSMDQAQRFLSAHAVVYNLFNLGRHLVKAKHYRNLREGAFDAWTTAVVWAHIGDCHGSGKVKLPIPLKVYCCFEKQRFICGAQERTWTSTPLRPLHLKLTLYKLSEVIRID